MRVFTEASLASLLAMVVSMTPMVMGIVYAFRPSEYRLALMRPLSLAGIKALLAQALAARDQVAHDDLDALIQTARRSQDASEGRRAMLEKRKPVFRGE